MTILVPPPPAIDKKSQSDLFAYEDFQEPSNIEDELRQFIDDYQNATLSDMTIEEAVWYTEGAVNYRNRHLRFAYEEVEITELSYTTILSATNMVSATAMTEMFDLSQQAIDAIAAPYKFIASDFAVTEHSGSSITFKISVASGMQLPSGQPPFAISGKDARAVSDYDCNNSGANKAAFKQAGRNAFKKYLNTLQFYPNIYYYYTKTISYGGLNRVISNDQLFGNTNAIISSHRLSQRPGDICVISSDIDSYRDAISNQVLALGRMPYVIQLKFDDYQFGGQTRYYWDYKTVVVSGENQAVHQPGT